MCVRPKQYLLVKEDSVEQWSGCCDEADTKARRQQFGQGVAADYSAIGTKRKKRRKSLFELKIIVRIIFYDQKVVGSGKA